MLQGKGHPIVLAKWCFILYTRYPIVARALGLAAFRPSARASKGILHTMFHTDHEPLKIIRKQKYPRDQLCKWILELENFDYRVEYVKGKDNPEADYLSRIITDNDNTPKFIQEINSVYLEEVIIPTMDVILIKKHLNADPLLLDATKQHADNDKISKGVFKSYSSLMVKDGILWKGDRIFIPKSLQKHIIREYHGQYHPGAENSVHLIKSRFYCILA